MSYFNFKKIKIMAEKKLAVTIPSVPNYIMVGKQMHSVALFSDDELREIGKEWIEKLVMHAREKRKRK